MSLFLSSVNNQKKSARRRASIGGVDHSNNNNNGDHFLKGVAVATLPNVLDLPDPPTPPLPPLDVGVGNSVGNNRQRHPHHFQAEQSQPPKKRRRRHSMSPCLSAKQNHPQHQHQHAYQHQHEHQHDNPKPLVFQAKETETADTDTNNTPSEPPKAQALLLQQQQQPLHPQQAPTMASMRPVLWRLRPAVHAYLEAYGQALDVAQQQQHPNNTNNSANTNNTDHWERVQQLQQELIHATTTKRHSHGSYNYVVNPPWLPTRLATTTIPCTTSENMNSTREHNNHVKDPQTDDHQRRRRWARQWQHWAPAFQQLQQHQQATAATTARVTGITVHKPKDMGGGNSSSLRSRGSNSVYQSWSERDQHFVTVSPRVYERQYSRMLDNNDNNNNNDIKPNWKEYFDQLRHADAQELKVRSAILDNAAATTTATTTTRPPPATCDKENAASVNTATDSTTANSIQKLRALPMRPVGKTCRNSPRRSLPNRALAVLSTASSPAPTITRPSPDTKTHLSIPRSESGEVLLAQSTSSSVTTTAGTTAASVDNGTGNSNSEDDGENENMQNDNIRSTLDSNNHHHPESTDRRENLDDHDNDDDDLDDFWLQPIPDRDAPSQHPEIAAAEERLFRALDMALETYSRQVIEIHRRDESVAQGRK